MPAPNILLGFVGDLLVDRADPSEAFALATDILRTPDILFGNFEGAYSDNPQPPLNSPPVLMFPGIANIEAFGAAGFGVISMANNHSVDAGHDALLDNIFRLNAMGVATCGAGADLTAARTAAIVERHGMKVAYLAYSSVFPMGYEARTHVPGLAPLRAYNFYSDVMPGFHMPGTLPRMQTIPDAADFDRLREDIAKAKAAADLVVTSFHWGDFFRPYHLTDHETRTARFAIDHGADIVVGHHHHTLRGMEWYAGKPILYGLGHFVFDARMESTDEFKKAVPVSDDPDNYGIAPRAGWPLLPMHADARMTILAWATVDNGRVSAIGFLPCRLLPNGQVAPKEIDSAEGAEIVDYVGRCCTTQRLNATLEVDDQVTIGGHRTMRVVPKQ